ncbi:hypothetical protein [Neisseria sp. 83E34]|nr:hypothetical protein [Neisseria sp. 83E34]
MGNVKGYYNRVEIQQCLSEKSDTAIISGDFFRQASGYIEQSIIVLVLKD